LRSAAITPRTLPLRGALKVIIGVPMLNEGYGDTLLPAALVRRGIGRLLCILATGTRSASIHTAEWALVSCQNKICKSCSGFRGGRDAAEYTRTFSNEVDLVSSRLRAIRIVIAGNRGFCNLNQWPGPSQVVPYKHRKRQYAVLITAYVL